LLAAGVLFSACGCAQKTEQPATKPPPSVGADKEQDKTEKCNHIHKLVQDNSPKSTATLEGYLQEGDFQVAFLAALALARRNNPKGLPTLKRALNRPEISDPAACIYGLRVLSDDPRYEALTALAALEPETALDRHVKYLESTRGIHRKLYSRSFHAKTLPFAVDLAVEGMARLARKEKKVPLLIARFRKRCSGRPRDSDSYHVLARLLERVGQREAAHKVRLEEIERTARCPQEVVLRRLHLNQEKDAEKYRKLLTLTREQVDKLREVSKAKPFMGSWSFDSLDRFREIVKFKITGALCGKRRFKEALKVLEQIFASNPKAEYGGSLFSAVNGVRLELLDYPRSKESYLRAYRETAQMYAEAVRKTPGDKELKLLYARVLLSAGMNPEASRLLQSLLRDEKRNVRANAAWLLGDFGRYWARRSAKDAVPALRKALKDEDAYVRKIAAGALQKIQKAKD